MLSERERRELHTIEEALASTDPGLARGLTIGRRSFSRRGPLAVIGLGGLGAVLGLLAISGPLVLVSLLVVAGGVLWDGSRRGEDAEKPS